MTFLLLYLICSCKLLKCLCIEKLFIYSLTMIITNVKSYVVFDTKLAVLEIEYLQLQLPNDFMQSTETSNPALSSARANYIAGVII